MMTMLDLKNFELPPIPSKRYFTIGEVSDLCMVKAHVLRYWEQEFDQILQVKRRGNRRYYQRHEVKLIRQIKTLLYDEGFTINGARTKLKQLIDDNQVGTTSVDAKFIEPLVSELEKVKNILR